MKLHTARLFRSSLREAKGRGKVKVKVRERERKGRKGNELE